MNAPSVSHAILISEPQGVTGELQFDNARPYFPYMWAILKSYWERHGDDGKSFHWLEPVWRNEQPARLLEPYSGQAIDVLGLSCYTWNWQLQCELAESVKATNPACLVVAGGPEPDYKDASFFIKHPYIDLIVVKDGEETFNRILARFAEGGRIFSDIGGIYYPRGIEREVTFSGPPAVPTVFDYSPYVDQADYYDRLLERHGHGFEVILETNRGCPYSCSFCDWGSNTNSKLRRFEMERVSAEIEWCGRLKVDSIMLADANFGILSRDLEIADIFNEVRARHGGYPRHIFYSAAKNNPERATEIAMKFAKSGICTMHALSVQHTRKEVLAATARRNISAEKQVEVVKTMMEAHVPVEVQLIQGIPGDTYQLWKLCLADLMEWGIHEDYLVQAYRLLPNAPAADPEYVREWRIETIERITYDLTTREIDDSRTNLLRKPEKILVATKTYSRADWVLMSTYSAFVKALHNSSLTQRIAVYLRLTHGVPYIDFYEHLIDQRPTALLATWYVRIHEHYEEFLTNSKASDHLPVDELLNLRYTLHPSRWIYISACLRLDEFFAQLKEQLLVRYPSAKNLSSLIDYQRDTIVTPAYDREIGKVIPTSFDWPSYFEKARVRDGSQSPLDEPGRLDGTALVAIGRVSGDRPIERDGVQMGGFYGEPLEWGSGGTLDQWAVWVEKVAIGRSSAGMHNHKEFRVISE